MRGDGKTTRQIQDAPRDAIFVWCNANLAYPRRLALLLGRTDLRIETPIFFSTERWRGLSKDVVLDHAFDPSTLSPSACEQFFEAMQYLSMRASADRVGHIRA